MLVKLKLLTDNKNLSSLRYGFHNTKDCKEFNLSFLCMQKCIDLNFDIAVANKHCKCTCFHKNGKNKFRLPNMPTKTNWKLGAPTTRIAPWLINISTTRNNSDDGSYSLEVETVAHESTSDNVVKTTIMDFSTNANDDTVVTSDVPKPEA